ncbi:hypothetical protein CFP56_035685 [Quercus suber]|uniref:Uncharacterized protein n=1 Tax=Quercus suber TaxID=58331 RepID=A0AAW0JAA3_QUESU|nr:hypothetical protein CFP56_02077 [Quercus suber]
MTSRSSSSKPSTRNSLSLPNPLLPTTLTLATQTASSATSSSKSLSRASLSSASMPSLTSALSLRTSPRRIEADGPGRFLVTHRVDGQFRLGQDQA